MPVIPAKTTSRPFQAPDLGRVTATELPGEQERVRLKQFDSIVEKGANLTDKILARQETKKKEDDDLAVNESVLAFESASRQKKLELRQLRGKAAENAFSELKTAQDRFWQKAVTPLDPEQVKLFEKRAAPIALQDNGQMAKFQAGVHNKRIDSNLKASSVAARTRSFDFLANKDEFDKNIAESIRLNDALLKRQGIDDTERENTGKSLLSSSVSEGIILMSAISNPRAEAWLDQSLKDGELSTQDAIKTKAALDKRKKANNEESLLTWAQTNTDKLIKRHGENRSVLFDQIEKQSSGEREVALKKETNIRLKQISDQNAENQRAFLQNGKQIIDQSISATEARKKVASVMGDPKATIATAKTLDSYIQDLFEKPAGRVVTNAASLDEVYTRINKTFAGTALQDEIIDSAAMIDLQYKGKLSPTDLKAAVAYQRNNGFFGKTTYDDLLQSFADMKGKSVPETRENKESMKEFVAYLDYARPKLPPDKVASPFTLQEISADFFIAGEREGETPRAKSSFLFTFGLDDFDSQTYQEAAEEGNGLLWQPSLNEKENKVAENLLAAENSLRIKQLKAPITNTEINRSRIYKQRVLLLDSVGGE